MCGFTLSNHPVQEEDNSKRCWDSVKGGHNTSIEVTAYYRLM